MDANLIHATLIEHDNVKQFMLFMNSMEPELLTGHGCRWRITNSKEFIIVYRGSASTLDLNFGNGETIEWIIRDNYTDDSVAAGGIASCCDHNECISIVECLLEMIDVSDLTQQDVLDHIYGYGKEE